MHPDLVAETALFSRARHLLLGGWRDIAEDVDRLMAALEGTLDECRCGEGRAHLAGTCPCCAVHDRSRHEPCADCVELLDQLRPRVDQMSAHTLRYLPALLELPAFTGPTEASERDALRSRLLGVTGTFRRLDAAVAEFERGCSSAHLNAVKDEVAELSQLIEQIQAALGLKTEEDKPCTTIVRTGP